MDTSTHQEFFDHYAKESVSPPTLQRMSHILQVILAVWRKFEDERVLDVADIGCGAGTFSRTWAEKGHKVVGVDINKPLVELAASRAAEDNLEIEFKVGSATAIPLEDQSVDVCVAAELLEHIEDWETAVTEFVRILKPGGLLWITTTNKICPQQDEFTLPGFSWYPAPLKRYYIQRALTDRPEIANYAKYPAYHWFTPFGLKRHLATLGMTAMDRFDIAYAYKEGATTRMILALVRAIPPLRFLGHMLRGGTIILARKDH